MPPNSVAELASVELQTGIYLERLVHIRVHMALALMQDESIIAEFADEVRTVGSQNQRTVATLLEQFVMALPVEVGIAHHDNLVDQIAGKLDRQRKRKGEPRPHTG